MPLVAHLHEALLVHAASDLLRLPHQAAATALLFLHRARAGFAQLDGLQDPPDTEVLNRGWVGRRDGCLWLQAPAVMPGLQRGACD